MATHKRDYYEILSVTRTASGEEIKKSYRKLALQYHPDRNPGDKKAEDSFKEAAEAYAVLSDPEKRAQYDQFGHSLGGRGFEGFEGFAENFSGFGDIFGDLFEDFFGGSSARGRGGVRPRRGADLQVTLEITLEDVLAGYETKIELSRRETCGECKGSRAEPGSKKTSCTDCGGRGEVRVSQGFFTLRRTCPRCRGEGERIEKPCHRCKGEGLVREKRSLKIKIPPGIDEASRLRLTGEGESGESGGPRGDLYVNVDIKSHSIFERRGNEIYCEMLIPFTLAVLGGEIPIPTLDGKESLKIPAGTPAGKVFQIKGKGLPALERPSVRGDELIRVDIEIPAKLSETERKLLQEFAKTRGEKVQTKKKGLFEQFKESL
ncbi:MAG: molecular chaperone DnaJ [Candidatus Omnitrophica bacterium]|nr:molecular chaperone DnaJ [Candidatus Omnitrophota bacterium]